VKLFRNLEVVDREDAQLVELQRRIGIESEFNRNYIEQELEARFKDKKRLRKRRISEHRSTDLYPTTLERVPERSSQNTSPIKSVLSVRPEESMVFSDSSDSESSDSSSEGEGENPCENGSEVDDDDGEEFDDPASSEILVHPISPKKRSVIVQIDDERDEDLVLLIDPSFASGI
jgi:hypothetical protein